MTISTNVVIDRIEVVNNMFVQVRQATQYIENGVVQTETYNRWVLSPGDVITNQDPSVQAICNVIWTPSVISAYQATQASAVTHS